MKIGIRTEADFDQESMMFYKVNYDILPTPDFSEKTRLLKPEHGLSFLGSPNNRMCRYCHKSEPEVSFSDDAHALPESTGNKALASHYECDECNHLFGEGIENEYGKFFNLYHNIANVKGKSGTPKFAYKIRCDKRTDECMKFCIKLDYVNETPRLLACKEVGDDYIKNGSNSIMLALPIPRCNPIAVYKAIVKMALTVMPFTDLMYYSHAIDWIRESNHKNIFPNDKRLIVKYAFIPGYGVTKYPHFAIYRRKATVFNLPHTLFHLTYGCLSMLIDVPRNNDRTGSSVKNIILPPTPYYSSDSEIWDMTESILSKDQRHRIALNFSGKEDITEELASEILNQK